MENNNYNSPQAFNHGDENSFGHPPHHPGYNDNAGMVQQPGHTPPVMNAPMPPAPQQGYGSYEQPAVWAPSAPNSRNFFKSAAYLPEYVVMLVLLLTAVGALTALIGIGIDSLIKTEQATSDSSLASLYGGGISAFQLIWSLSALIVSLPVFAWLFVRTRRAELENPKVKQHRWRKAFLGIFLVLEGLTAVCTVGALIFDLLARVIGGDQGLLSYLSSGGPDPWWQGVIVTIASVAVLLLTIFVMSRDYRSKEAAQGVRHGSA